MIPYLTLTDHRKGYLRQVSQYIPKSGLEKAIIDSLNSLFDNPNYGGYIKDATKDYYIVEVYTDERLTKEDLRKLELDSGCKVEVQHGMYGLSFFFTPNSKLIDADLNPSER